MEFDELRRGAGQTDTKPRESGPQADSEGNDAASQQEKAQRAQRGRPADNCRCGILRTGGKATVNSINRRSR
jgi:hypothetical protein